MTTKNLIPRASGEGGIGITDVTWGYGYYDTGNFNKGLFVSGHNITQVIAETVTQGGLGGEWTRNGLDIYYNGGNVGIGTTDPGAKLDIFGSNSSLKFTRDAGDRSAEMVYDGSKFLIKTPAGDRLSITDASSNELLTVNPNNGNVGIGTTNPNRKIHVHTDTAVTQQISCTSLIGGLVLSHAAMGHGVDLIGDLELSNAVGNLKVFLTAEGKSYFNGGNVGIGTTDPEATLHAYSSVNANTPTAKFYNGWGSSVATVHIIEDSTSTNHVGLFVGQDDLSSAVLITKYNNVGIGTTSPSAKLDILGSFKLNNPGGATLYPSSIDVYKNGTTASLKHSAIFNTGGWRNATVIESVTGTTPSNFSTEGLYLNSTYGSKPFTSASIQVNCSAGNGDISFLTGDGSAAPTSKIKLQHNGDVGIGVTSPDAKLHIQGDDNAAYSPTNRLQRNGATLFVYNTSEVNNSYSQLVLGNRQSSGSMSRIVSVLLASGTSELSFSTTKNTIQKECMAISNDGVRVNDLTANADVTTNAAKYLSTSSDKRLKNDLGDCEYGLNEVLQVQPKRYTWKDGPKDANPTVGFFAQDVHDVMPEAAPREAIQNEKGEDDYKWGFHSQTIIAALVNATKEQQQLIEDLRSEVEALKNK